MDPLVKKAIDIATEAHDGQLRGQDPYVLHPISCMTILSTECDVVDSEVLAAAIGHDIIEDTKVTTDALTDLLGENVVKVILECTDDPNDSPKDKKQRKLAHAHLLSNNAKLVKGADCLDNVRSLFKFDRKKWSLLTPDVLVTFLPNGWSADEGIGYAVWAYCISQLIKGVN